MGFNSGFKGLNTNSTTSEMMLNKGAQGS